MSGPDTLLEHAGRLRTRMGACFPGSHAVFRGHDLHRELRDIDWVELYLFGITGRRFPAEQIRLLHALWTYTSYPDARLWNNRVAALAGSARSTPTLGMAAALAVSDAVVYGGHPFIRAADFLRQAKARQDRGEALADIVEAELRQRRIYGYGRPINSQDERLPWLLALARETGLADGPYLKLALAVEAILVAHRPLLRMNFAALAAALAADLGLSPREFHTFMFPAFLAGMSPCALETQERPEGASFPVACTMLHYHGPPKRSWNPVDRETRHRGEVR